jgi:hypothetical protein
MNQYSEERASDVVVPLPVRGQVVPFERPQSELQRAVQERAQERIDRARSKPRIGPMRMIVTIAVATIPVLILLGMINGAVRGIHLLTNFYAARATATATTKSPPSPTAKPQQSDVVLLVPTDPAKQPPAENAPAAESTAK